MIMQNKPLEGKVALVTGAGSPIGLGRHMTLALVRAGARVAMLDVNADWLEQTSSDMREVGGDDSVFTMVSDVSKPESAEDAVSRTIAELGGLHILINNAGISAGNLGPNRMNFWDISPESWNKVLSVNLNGPFYMARAAVGHMIDQKWGRIIGVTTSMDTMYREGMSPYGPSKAGHEALIALMSRELEGTGVTANVLVPGGASDTNILPPETPYDRAALIRPDVMQDPVVWLASDASQEINGRRFIARNWDESLPIEERLEKAGAPAAWPQLGRQSVAPGRE
ncbi:MAG TPA: SDR family oxidoreductase [Dehalococcoidia bacterium]|nr:SDR family oxidoreductase [Dehalococcoidia bacterium]